MKFRLVSSRKEKRKGRYYRIRRDYVTYGVLVQALFLPRCFSYLNDKKTGSRDDGLLLHPSLVN